MMTQKEAAEKASTMTKLGWYYTTCVIGSRDCGHGLEPYTHCSVYIDGLAYSCETFEECFEKHGEK